MGRGYDARGGAPPSVTKLVRSRVEGGTPLRSSGTPVPLVPGPAPPGAPEGPLRAERNSTTMKSLTAAAAAAAMLAVLAAGAPTVRAQASGSGVAALQVALYARALYTS